MNELEKIRSRSQWCESNIDEFLNNPFEGECESALTVVQNDRATLLQMVDDLQAKYDRLIERDTNNLAKLIKANERISELDAKWGELHQLHRKWRRILDNDRNESRSPVVQRARDEVLKECADRLEAIIKKDTDHD